jgi:hypothetical protein
MYPTLDKTATHLRLIHSKGKYSQRESGTGWFIMRDVMRHGEKYYVNIREFRNGIYSHRDYDVPTLHDVANILVSNSN